MRFRVAYEAERVRRQAEVTTTVIRARYVEIGVAPRDRERPERPAARGGGRAGSRTVAKANYRRLSGASARGRLRASLDYYQHRPDADGSRGSRPVFGADGALSADDADAMIEGTHAPYGYRVVLSPGVEMDASDLEVWTRAVMEHLVEEGTVSGWLGVAHAEQTDHPHAHVIAFTGRGLDREDLGALRLVGDVEAERVTEATWTRRLESEFDTADYGFGASPRATGGQALEAGGGGGAAEEKRRAEVGLEDENLNF